MGIERIALVAIETNILIPLEARICPEEEKNNLTYSVIYDKCTVAEIIWTLIYQRNKEKKEKIDIQ